MSCEYCEEGRTLFASAEGRACDIDDISVERLCVLVRCGCAGGGKGALVSDEVSLTLSTSNTQTLFSEEGGDMVVRRLTPRECERLQGFPDDWTKIPYRGKPADECPDGPRYKAIGNSMAVPVMRWIGERIAMAEAGEIARATTRMNGRARGAARRTAIRSTRATRANFGKTTRSASAKSAKSAVTR